MDLENKIIEFFAGSSLKLGWVTRQQKEKLQVEDENLRRVGLREKDVLVVFGNHAGGDFGPAATALHAKIAEQAEEIDTEFLWETVAEAGGEYEAKELAKEYFGDSSALQQAAILRALVEDGQFFKRRATTFTPRSAEDLEKVRLQQARKEAREAMQARAGDWIREVLNAKEPLTEIEPAMQDFMGLVEAYMYQGHRNDAAGLLDGADRRMNAREVGLTLMENTGRLKPDDDPFLLVNGVQSGFSEAVTAHAAGLAGFVAGGDGDDREDLRDLFCFTIDDAETREVDDALSLRRDGANLVVGIHIADPATFIQKADPLDRVAADRPLTLYLPTSVVTMLPERIGCDLASLNLGLDRPTLSFEVIFDAAHQIVSWRFGRAQIRVSRRLDYEETDAVLSGPAAPFADDLKQLHAVAQTLNAERMAAGALRIVRPELKVRVVNGEVEVKVLDSTSASREIVSEMMILANRLAAEFGLRHDVPIIYRTQDPPPNPIAPMTEYDPNVFDQAVRQLKRSRMSTHPVRHAGLGLDVYTQVSSPIRRYSDLVMQRQLSAHMAGQELPYSPTEIVEVLSAADGVEGQNRRMERESTRYWILEYLRRYHVGSDVFEAGVVDDGRGGTLVEVLPYTSRGRMTGPGAGALKPGDRLQVTITAVDPKRNTMSLKPA